MINIVVTNTSIREMKGVGKASGKPYHMRIQSAYLYTVDPASGEVAEIPDKFEIALEDAQQPYARGKYQLQPSAVFVNYDGRLDVRPRLALVNAKA
jgi:hypothetical protein